MCELKFRTVPTHTHCTYCTVQVSDFCKVSDFYGIKVTVMSASVSVVCFTAV